MGNIAAKEMDECSQRDESVKCSGQRVGEVGDTRPRVAGREGMRGEVEKYSRPPRPHPRLTKTEDKKQNSLGSGWGSQGAAAAGIQN